MLTPYNDYLVDVRAFTQKSKMSATGVILEHLERKRRRDVSAPTFMTFAKGHRLALTLRQSDQDLSYISTVLTRGGTLSGMDVTAALTTLRVARHQAGRNSEVPGAID